MIFRVRKSGSMGALGRRFERDRVFQHGPTITGPAATPAGSDNADLSLRFGIYPEIQMPRHGRLGPVAWVQGANAARWAELSDMDAGWLVLGKRLAVRWAR